MFSNFRVTWVHVFLFFIAETMDRERDEEQEEMLREMIVGGDDITSQYLNDSGEGVEDLDRRGGSDEGMDGENAIIKPSEVYKLSCC